MVSCSYSPYWLCVSHRPVVSRHQLRCRGIGLSSVIVMRCCGTSCGVATSVSTCNAGELRCYGISCGVVASWRSSRLRGMQW